MLVVSFKAPKTKFFAIGVLVTSLVIVSGLILFGGNKAITTDKTTVKLLVGETNDDRINYLKNFGWEVKAEPSEIVEIGIPTEFDEVYENYNIIQKKQGFDLLNYRGKRVKRFTYEITNYPDKPEHVRANILVFEGKIIGGDVSSVELKGFMHGFKLE